MKITRRGFVGGIAAGSALASRSTRSLAMPTALPRDVDVVVIGAGAAGIAAARKVAAAGRKVVVIEASNRIGGRCFTDATTFATAYDRGARSLYLPDSNPVAKLARSAGMDLYPAPQDQKIRIGRRNARASETEDFLTTLVRVNRALSDAGRGKADVSAANAIPHDAGDWTATAAYVLGPLVTGKDLTEISVFDLTHAQERNVAAFCRQGLGTLIAKLGETVPTVLSTPVTRVIWRDRDADIETSAGKLTARAVIVTTSINVMLSGAMPFSPDLPKRLTDAASKLSLGTIDRVTLDLPGNPLGIQRDEVAIEMSDNNQTAVLQGNVDGSSLCHVDVFGSFGRGLAAKGDDAIKSFAIEWLAKLYSPDIGNAVKGASVTRWSAMPLALGAVSAASPGGQPSRKILMEPMGSLFFAGDAVHETLWGTVGGAWESGERAADAALLKLSGAKVQQAAQPPAPVKRQRRQTNPSTTDSGFRSIIR